MAQHRSRTIYKNKNAGSSPKGVARTVGPVHQAASKRPASHRAVRVSPTTRRIGREIIADRHDVLRELANR